MATTLLTKYGTGTRVRGAFNQWMRARAGVGTKQQNLASAKNIYNKYLAESKTAKHSMTQAFNVMAGLESPLKESKTALSDATSAQKKAKETYTSAKEAYEPTVGPYTKAKEAFDLAKGTVTKAQATYDTAYSAYETASTKSKKFQEAFTTAETDFNPLQEQASTLKKTGESALEQYNTLKTKYDARTSEISTFQTADADKRNRLGRKDYLMKMNPPQGRSAIRMRERSITGIDVYDNLKTATEDYRLAEVKFRTGDWMDKAGIKHPNIGNIKKFLYESDFDGKSRGYLDLKDGKDFSDYGALEDAEFSVSSEDVFNNVSKFFENFSGKWWNPDDLNRLKTGLTGWLSDYQSAGEKLDKARKAFGKYQDEYTGWETQSGKLSKKYETAVADYKKLTESDDYVTKGKSYQKAKYFHEEAQKRFKSAKEAMEAAKTPYEEAITAYEATVNPYEEASKAYTPAKSAFEKAEEEYGASQDAYKDAYKAYQSANTQYQTASQGFSDAQSIYQRYVGNTGHLALAKGDVGTAQTALTGAISNMVRFQSGYAGERVRARAGRAGMRAKRTRRVSPLLGYI